MTDKERLDAIIDALLPIRREMCRTMARLKAFEAVVLESVPPDEREQWYEQIDRQYDRCLQDVLEEFESYYRDLPLYWMTAARTNSEVWSRFEEILSFNWHSFRSNFRIAEPVS